MERVNLEEIELRDISVFVRVGVTPEFLDLIAKKIDDALKDVGFTVTEYGALRKDGIDYSGEISLYQFATAGLHEEKESE